MILIGKRQTSTRVGKDQCRDLWVERWSKGLPKARQQLQSTLWYLNRTSLRPQAGFNRTQQGRRQKVKEEKSTFRTITYSLILINRKPLRNQIRKSKEKEFKIVWSKAIIRAACSCASPGWHKHE